MNPLKKIAQAIALLGTFSAASVSAGEICDYAPSRNAAVNHVGAASGGASVGVAATAQMAGITAVAHSSGSLILTGGSGYIAGTLGVAAIGPAIVLVGATIGTTAVVLEVACLKRNHPQALARFRP